MRAVDKHPLPANLKRGEVVPPNLGLPGVISATSYTPPANLDFDSWKAVGETLGRIEGSVMWWVGDWWAFGDLKYGEKASQGTDEGGPSTQTLMNAGWVSRQVEISRRREILSWSHHAEVAALEPDEQTEWLDRAVLFKKVRYA